jgi:RNA polymerase sigma-70 factor, ECF subfamily
LCIRYCGNTADAEDVLHDGFIKIIQNLSSFKQRPNGNFESWMRRIMVNTALNHLRDHAREKCFLKLPDIADLEDEVPEIDDYFRSLAERISPEEVLDLVNQLPPGYSVVLNLYVFEEYTHAEIAELLNCSESNSKSQLFRARAMIRKKIAEYLIKQKDKNPITHATTG